MRYPLTLAAESSKRSSSHVIATKAGMQYCAQPQSLYGLEAPPQTTQGDFVRATETKLSEFLTKQQVQYSIPIYQRTYSWRVE